LGHNGSGIGPEHTLGTLPAPLGVKPSGDGSSNISNFSIHPTKAKIIVISVFDQKTPVFEVLLFYQTFFLKKCNAPKSLKQSHFTPKRSKRTWASTRKVIVYLDPAVRST